MNKRLRRLALILCLLVFINYSLNIIANWKTYIVEETKSKPNIFDKIIRPWRYLYTHSTAQFFKPKVDSPRFAFLITPWLLRGLATLASAFMPILPVSAQERGNLTTTSPTGRIEQFSGFDEDDPLPTPWSELTEKFTTYEYMTIWGNYTFSRALPFSVFHHNNVDYGYCMDETIDVSGVCKEWHSNYALNMTAFFWIYLNDRPMNPISFSVLAAKQEFFEAYAVGNYRDSLYSFRMLVDFTVQAPMPKISLWAEHVSGPKLKVNIVMAAEIPMNANMDIGVAHPLENYRNTYAYIGKLEKIRFSLEDKPPNQWENIFILDSSDYGEADTYVGSFELFGQRFTGVLVKYGDDKLYIDPGVNVFDGGSVAIGTSNTTILTANTTLPAGTNLIIVGLQVDNTASAIRIIQLFEVRRGTTVLAAMQFSFSIPINNADSDTSSLFLLAVDASAPGNASYTVVARADGTSVNGEAKMMVIQTSDYAYVDGGSVAIGTSETTLATVNTSLAAGPKVVVAAIQVDNTTASTQLFAANAFRIRRGTTELASNEFPLRLGSLGSTNVAFVMLIAYDSPTSANPSYSATATAPVTGINGEAKILVFNVGGAAFLDTGSVAVGTSETTIANLTTSFASGQTIAVLAVVSLINSSSAAIAVNPIRLQQNNSTAGERINEFSLFLPNANSVSHTKQVFLPNIYTNIPNNPSYQVKATTTAAGANGEAKIIAFALSQTITQNLSETTTVSEGIQKAFFKRLAISISISDALVRFVRIPIQIGETIGVFDSVVRWLSGMRSISETIAVNDSIVKSLLKYVETVVVSVSDIIVRTRRAAVLMTESISLSENFNKTVVKSIQLTVSVSDTLTRIISQVMLLIESITVSDIMYRIRFSGITLGEAIQIQDVTTRTLTFQRIIAESTTVSEQLLRIFYRSVALFEPISVNANLVVGRMFQRALTESANISDIVIKAVSKTIQLESTWVSETLAFQIKRVVFIIETMLFSDELSIGFLRVIEETIDLNDLIGFGNRYIISFLENLPIGDTINRRLQAIRSITDIIDITSFLWIYSPYVYLSEVVNILASNLQSFISQGTGGGGGTMPDSPQPPVTPPPQIVVDSVLTTLGLGAVLFGAMLVVVVQRQRRRRVMGLLWSDERNKQRRKKIVRWRPTRFSAKVKNWVRRMYKERLGE